MGRNVGSGERAARIGAGVCLIVFALAGGPGAGSPTTRLAAAAVGSLLLVTAALSY